MDSKLTNQQTRLRTTSEIFPEIVCEQHPEWVELYRLACSLGLENIEFVDKEGWHPQLTCMPGEGKLWLWDSCFMALFARYTNGLLPGLNNLDNLYQFQREDGFLAMCYVIEDGSPAYGERINPPLLAWAEWQSFRMSGDVGRLERVFPRLLKLHQWLMRNRRRENGLFWFEDTGSSGMDNSPRSGYYAKHLDGSDVCFVDLACQMVLSALYLSRIAAQLGDKDTECKLSQQHTELAALVNRYHWCERHGFYYDVFNGLPGRTPNFLNTKTAAGFWPLIAGVSSHRQTLSLMEHLLNPHEFGTPHPVPTLARSDANFTPLGGYWLGSVWAPINYMVCSGLESVKKGSLAREIAVKHLNAMVDVMHNPAYGGIWECYSPEYPRPASRYDTDDIVRNRFVGWSGLGPVAMLIENIFGMDFDAPASTIRWEVRTQGCHGVRNLDFNGGRVSLEVVEDGSKADPRMIRIESTLPLTLILSVAGRHRREEKNLPAGETMLAF
jgi:glycogen debranching enzyme